MEGEGNGPCGVEVWDAASLSSWLVSHCWIRPSLASLYSAQLIDLGFDSPLSLSLAAERDWPAQVKVGHRRAIAARANQLVGAHARLRCHTALVPPPSPPPSPPSLSLPWHWPDRFSFSELKSQGAPKYTAAGKSRLVRVRMVVNRVLNIDLKSQCFTAELKVECSWTDDEMLRAAKGEHETAAECLRLLSADDERTNQQHGRLYVKKEGHERPVDECFFAPRIYFRNLIDKENSEEWFTFRPSEKDEDKVVVSFVRSLRGTFQERFELEHFPFDEQDLTMEMASRWAREDGKNAVQLERNENEKYRSFVNTSSFLQSGSYRLFSRLRFTRDTTKPHESNSNLTYPLLQIGMRVHRQWWFWIQSVVIPLFFLTTALCTSFVVSEDEFADRAGITLTSLLAMVAFQTVIAERLPDDISYMTSIDLYVLISFIFSFSVIMWQSISALSAAPVDDPNNFGIEPEEPFFTHRFAGFLYRVPNYFVGSVLGWLGFHVFLALFLYWTIVWRRQRARFWHATARGLWLGPIVVDALRHWNPDAQDHEWDFELKRAVEGAIMRRVQALEVMQQDRHRLVNVRLWCAEEAQKHLRNDVNVYPFRARVLDCVLRTRRLMTPTVLDASSSFAVLTLDTERGARDLLDFSREELEAFRAFLTELQASITTCCPELGAAPPDRRAPAVASLAKVITHRTRLEELNPSWYSLTKPFAPPVPRRAKMDELGPLCTKELHNEQFDLILKYSAHLTTSKVTLLTIPSDHPTRLTLEIPPNATHFAFAYPPSKDSPLSSIIPHGGYVYWDTTQAGSTPTSPKDEEGRPSDGSKSASTSSNGARPNTAGSEETRPSSLTPPPLRESVVSVDKDRRLSELNRQSICCITALGEGPGLAFRRRTILHQCDWEHLRKHYTFHRVTLPRLMEMKVYSFCWIPPAPCNDLADDNIPCDSALGCPHGAFAYIYNDAKHVPGFDCVFKLKLPLTPFTITGRVQAAAQMEY